MSWIALALVSAALFGIANILEKHVLSSRLTSIKPYLVILGTVSAFSGFIFFSISGVPNDTPIKALILAIIAAILFAAGLAMVFLALQREEVSRVVPLRQLTPIFVTILAVFFLGERLSLLEWGAMLVTVAGAILISIKRDPDSGGIVLGRTFFLLAGSSLLVAISNVLVKEALADLSVWTVIGINHLGLAAIFYITTLRPSTIRQLHQMAKQRTPLYLALAAEIIATIASLAQFWSYSLGAISLATVVLATRPFFVLVYATILSLWVPSIVKETGGRGTITLKLVSITMIISGVGVIAIVS
jgi:transporter family protein